MLVAEVFVISIQVFPACKFGLDKTIPFSRIMVTWFQYFELSQYYFQITFETRDQ
jgi:hypothetical protein